VFHGSVGAPAVNIAEVSIPAGILVSNLGFGEAQGYLDLSSIDYTLQVQTATGEGVAEFSAPLSLFPDEALFIIASGYLDTTGVTPNESFKLLVVRSNGRVVEINYNTARLQVIHNSAAKAAAMVDVWITNVLGSKKLLSDFSYKQAAGYIDVQAGVNFIVSITAPGSNDTSMAVLHKSFKLLSDLAYLVVAAGDPGNNFDLFATEGMEQVTTSGNVDVKVFHGSTGAPVVDVVEVSIPAGTIVNDLAFGEFQGYLDLAPLDYDLQIRTQSGIAAAEFSAPLSGFANNVLSVLASGYLDTTGTGTSNTFRLLAVNALGQVIELLPKSKLTSSFVQIIHNSAVPAADSVDVYVNGLKAIDNFAFRTATGFLELPSATELIVDIADKKSQDNTMPLFTKKFVLEPNQNYIVVASGNFVIGSETYTPMKDFDLIAIPMARKVAENTSKVEVLVFHGSTDAPMVDVNETTVPVNELIDDIEYGEYAGYLDLDPAAYELEIAVASSGASVKTYEADITGLTGKAITILASGYLNPSQNNNGEPFGLYVALAEGGNLIMLPEVTTNNVEENFVAETEIVPFPNPAIDELFISGISQKTKLSIYNLQGALILETTIDNSSSVDVSALKRGIYMISIHSDSKSQSIMFNKF
jgi:hypothetical protein